jgi:hypothetical protein
MKASLVCCFVLLISARAAGQDIAAAEELYRRGVADFHAGQYEIACRELKDSYRIDPLLGVLFTLATCEARAGRLATAAAHYDDFLQRLATLPPDKKAVQEERRQVAASQRASLTPDLSYLTISLSAQLLQKGATVRRDGTILVTASVGIELPIDPGPHVVTVQTPDGSTQEQRISVAKREHRTVVFEPLAPAPVPDRPVVLERRAVSPWIYISAGVGVAGVGVGSVAGLLAVSEKGVVDAHCAGPACNAEGKAAADTARTEAWVSTVGFGVGIAGLATAMIIYFAGRPSSRASQPAQSGTPAIGLAWRSVTLGGSF